ncbi:hypothetical protein D3H55_01080 [Bacillus salacetis]|uniref:Uncharacterized protein n=1 Tax=Bacillus salacetis TaxID=2315464 RepID=A0A3A1RDD9_9BACI|nr:hypothetical protein [Bacillus salacetis]RIW38975.1 hypothetical protein D3H55_01080 [Bacillus salacetis]
MNSFDREFKAFDLMTKHLFGDFGMSFGCFGAFIDGTGIGFGDFRLSFGENHLPTDQTAISDTSTTATKEVP